MAPSQYLKSVRWVMQNLPADVCGDVLDGIEKGEIDLRALMMPRYVPAKYHARMHEVWKTMVLGVLFSNALRKYSLMQRHRILQTCLDRKVAER